MGYLVHRLRQHSANTVLGATSTEVLTRRERQVGQLVARGLTNRDIAEELGLSEHTVKNYLLVMFEKLNVSTRVELALLFVGSSEVRARGGPEAEGDAAIPS
jgi:DNA-binding NarL/FixJ family response regulator